MVQRAPARYPVRKSLSFTLETSTIIDIIKRQFLELVMAQEGRNEKAETIKRKIMHDPKWNTIIQFVIGHILVHQSA